MLASTFSPDRSVWSSDFAGLRTVLQAVARLSAINRAPFDALADSDTQFEVAETKMPFTGADFLFNLSWPLIIIATEPARFGRVLYRLSNTRPLYRAAISRRSSRPAPKAWRSGHQRRSATMSSSCA